jgi:hypothetical protein
MEAMSDERVLGLLSEIRNWIRASSYGGVKTLLETALPDEKSRSAYQMLDGSTTLEDVRKTCKMSPNSVVALAQRWTSMGIMELRGDKKRVRLFDLSDFGLMSDNGNASLKIRKSK